jgi:hypothetical protein
MAFRANLEGNVLEIPSAADDEISLWLRDILEGAEDAIREGPRMHLNASQMSELQAEADFYRALLNESASVPRPSDAILKAVVEAIEGWQEVVDYVPREPLSITRIAARDALAFRLQRLRKSMDAIR